jgi:hypothetical protein
LVTIDRVAWAIGEGSLAVRLVFSRLTQATGSVVAKPVGKLHRCEAREGLRTCRHRHDALQQVPQHPLVLLRQGCH